MTTATATIAPATPYPHEEPFNLSQYIQEHGVGLIWGPNLSGRELTFRDKATGVSVSCTLGEVNPVKATRDSLALAIALAVPDRVYLLLKDALEEEGWEILVHGPSILSVPADTLPIGTGFRGYSVTSDGFINNKSTYMAVTVKDTGSRQYLNTFNGLLADGNGLLVREVLGLGVI